MMGPFVKEMSDTAESGSGPREPGPTLPMSTVARLLESVVAIGQGNDTIAARRMGFLSALGETAGADAGWWVWGRGWPEGGAVTPLAILDFGLTDETRSMLLQWGIDNEAMTDFRGRILARLGSSRQATTDRSIYTDAEWETRPPILKTLEKGAWGSWIHSIRYGSADTWSHIFLLRDDVRPPFSDDDVRLVDLCMESICWMHAGVDETVPAGAFVGLTERQRTVLFLLLDGASRKKIARGMGISEDTVGDHIKAVYAHFGVSSSTELAAIFLRSR